MGEPQRRVIASGLTFERPTDTTRVETHSDLLTTLAIFVFRPLWSYRIELGLLGVVGGLCVAMASFSNALVGALVTAGLLALLLQWKQSRHLIRSLLHRCQVRRQWEQACRYSAVVTMNDRTPAIRRMVETPAGDVLTVQVPPSMSCIPLDAASEVLAAGLSAREVRVERDPNRANLAKVSIIRRDPLGESTPLAWPNLNADVLSIWQPIPLGVDEMGETVTVSLPERNMMVAGEPGGGKSVGVSMPVATAALDPSCELFLLDGKQVELAVWSGCARGVVGPSLDDAISMLRLVQSEMNTRYERLLVSRKRKVSPDDGIPLQVVVCDELAYYLTIGDRKAQNEFATLARDVVARGRAAGIIFIAATQKPSHEIIPTALRDLFAFRWALRCTTPQASDTVLGAGWASQDYSAATIDAAHRGVGYLLAEGGVPQRMRSFYLSDGDLDVLARRGEELRRQSKEVVVPITPAA